MLYAPRRKALEQLVSSVKKDRNLESTYHHEFPLVTCS